jgi:cell division septum initiation protein DivIVA
VDMQAKLDELIEMVESARAMPMSASCLVNRTELLDHLRELRDLLPSEVRDAQAMLRDRGTLLDEVRREADEVVRRARDERSRLLAKAEVVREATVEAERIRAAAQADGQRMQREVDDYVDTKLANFEVALTKTLRAVERGRAKLRGRTGLEDLAGEG